MQNFYNISFEEFAAIFMHEFVKIQNITGLAKMSLDPLKGFQNQSLLKSISEFSDIAASISLNVMGVKNIMNYSQLLSHFCPEHNQNILRM